MHGSRQTTQSSSDPRPASAAGTALAIEARDLGKRFLKSGVIFSIEFIELELSVIFFVYGDATEIRQIIECLGEVLQLLR